MSEMAGKALKTIKKLYKDNGWLNLEKLVKEKMIEIARDKKTGKIIPYTQEIPDDDEMARVI